MQWISILKCPITGSALQLLDTNGIALLRQKTLNGQLWRAGGVPVTEFVEQGLRCEDGRYIYPIVKGVVLLLKELAITDSPEWVAETTLSADKKLVKSFYDDKGWVENASGNYQDAVIYEDLRKVSSTYVQRCHNRVGRSLKTTGTYLLDAGSGALQFPAYLQYSAGYTYRVCVDFSLTALMEAKRKLGEKGICILGDLTNLPLKDGMMDGFICLNAVYHIPENEQVVAIKELYRVLAPGGKGVVVYDWFKHAPWMNIALLPFRGFVFIKNRLMDTVGKLFNTKGASRRLYFYAHPPAYFRTHLPPYELKVWRTLSVPFMRYYIHPWLFGERILDWVYRKEEKYPALCGLKGEYPMLVFEK
jgi:ubiquinone/menaquinone biosynthesis C-methylase UbiE/uncharacterized protein YbaR (Trm112 family)